MLRILLLLLALLAVLGLPTARLAMAAPRCFPEAGPAISACIDGRIRGFWEAQGGLPVFGYPLGPDVGGVQIFERARLELHPENTPPYDVLLGRLGADSLAARGEPAAPRETPRPGCRFFETTGLNLCSPFLEAYERYGLNLDQPGVSAAESLALFGLPLTAPRQEQLSDGQTYTVQWFERARFEDHGPQGVLFGLLGSEQHPAAGSPASAGTALEPGGFIEAKGDQLTRLGRPVTIKGVNYYPQGRPWEEMWQSWDGEQIQRELQLGRDQLGINAVRVLLPYKVVMNAEGEGIVNERVLAQLRQLTQIAGDLDMRLIVTLFDFYGDFPLPDTQAEEANLDYLRALLSNFAGDERIMAWDLHNEPEHYDLWAKAGKADQVLVWLSRMADAAKQLAPNQLITVGMGHYENLWLPGPDGRRVIDYSDVVSIHIYNAADAARQLDEIRRHTGKPILLQEFGWPTGPACSVRAYSEAEQAQVYRGMLAAAQGRVAGVIAWTLRDYDAGPTMRWETREEHYGLYRPDGSLKPAAEVLRAMQSTPLPSLTRTNEPLTINKNGPPTDERAPLFIAEGGHYVKGEFRLAWDAFSGRYNFGVPVSEAFVRASDRRVVQYFSAAVLELHPEATDDPNFYDYPPEEQLRRLVRFVNIGSSYTQRRGFPAQEGVDHDPDYYFPETGYSVDPEFRRYFSSLGGRWRLGAAISGKIEEQIDGLTMRVQYFQNGRLQHNPSTQSIEAGRLGSWAWDVQCTYVP